MNEKIEYVDLKSSFHDKREIFEANKNKPKNNVNQSKKFDENNIKQSKTSNNLNQNIYSQHKEEIKTKINNTNKISEKKNKKMNQIK